MHKLGVKMILAGNNKKLVQVWRQKETRYCEIMESGDIYGGIHFIASESRPEFGETTLFVRGRDSDRDNFVSPSYCGDSTCWKAYMILIDKLNDEANKTRILEV